MSYGVFFISGAIGSNSHRIGQKAEESFCYWTFEDKAEAQIKAKRLNSTLTAGEKKYYKMKYKVLAL